MYSHYDHELKRVVLWTTDKILSSRKEHQRTSERESPSLHNTSQGFGVASCSLDASRQIWGAIRIGPYNC